MQMQHFAIIFYLSRDRFEACSTIQQSSSVARIDTENSIPHSWELLRLLQAAYLVIEASLLWVCKLTNIVFYLQNYYEIFQPYRK